MSTTSAGIMNSKMLVSNFQIYQNHFTHIPSLKQITAPETPTYKVIPPTNMSLETVPVCSDRNSQKGCV